MNTTKQLIHLLGETDSRIISCALTIKRASENKELYELIEDVRKSSPEDYGDVEIVCLIVYGMTKSLL